MTSCLVTRSISSMRATSKVDMPGLLPDRLGALLRDHADFGERVAGMRLDFEPDAKARLRLPDRNHFGAGIARDHRGVQAGEEQRRLQDLRDRISRIFGAVSKGSALARLPRLRHANCMGETIKENRRAPVKVDVIVLGAGVVGVSAALHLQARGRDVVDRRSSRRGGERDELWQCGHHPERGGFPLYVSTRPARNDDGRAEPRSARANPLQRAGRRSGLGSGAIFSPRRRRPGQTGAKALRPLAARSVVEHEAFAAPAGSSALLRKSGWIKVFRSERGRAGGARRSRGAEALWRQRPSMLDRSAQSTSLEPHLSDAALGGVHFTDPSTTPDPGALGEILCRTVHRTRRAAARRRRPHAGAIRRPDGRSRLARGALQAADVGALRSAPGLRTCSRRSAIAFRSASSAAITCISAPTGNATSIAPCMDAEFGYVLAPQTRGIRLTTGAEFARPRRPPSLGPFRPDRAARARTLPARRAARRRALARPAALPARHAAGDRRRAAPQGPVVRFRPPASRSDAGAGQRPSAGATHDGRGAARPIPRPIGRSGSNSKR